MIDVRATRNQFNSFNWIKTILTILTKGSYNMSKTRHGSSDGRAGNSESKGPGFNPCMDPMRLCFKICGVFSLYHFCIKSLHKHEKSEKADFDKRLECAAPKRWWKYTAQSVKATSYTSLLNWSKCLHTHF